MTRPFWFVLKYFDYEGINIVKHISEGRAREEYARAKASRFVDGCALINGDLVEVTNIPELERRK